MNKYSKQEKEFISKGYIVKKAEKAFALNYISNLLKKKIIKYLNSKKINTKYFSFSNLHKFIDVSDLNEIRLRLIEEVNKDNKFRENYFILAKETLFSIVGNELAMQNKINLSIQIPKDDSSILPLHADSWSGDSPFESVLWLPMVNCFKTNSMFILNSSKEEKVKRIFKKKNIRLSSGIYNSLKKDLTFLKINYGNFLLFNQNLPHGNVRNKTKQTRISFNCRFKGLFTPYSQKKLGKFFSPITIRPTSKIGLAYKFPGE